jgi:2-amino-4-hydroxy-6-hydroxymethyldihydropteridine diphosphokinase
MVVLGLGSNVPHGRHGAPADVLRAAVRALADGGFAVEQMARVRQTAPVGPSSRRYANSAVLGHWDADPQALLGLCQQVERDFGRRPGRRWGARVLDVDIWLIGARRIGEPDLIVPHPGLAARDFALRPLVELAANWRHPGLGLTARHLLGRLEKRHPVDFAAATD